MISRAQLRENNTEKVGLAGPQGFATIALRVMEVCEMEKTEIQDNHGL